MSRGLGWVQWACLEAIREYEEEGKRWPTTYNITADIYQIKRNAKGNRLVKDAQHVATKRALESLQRQGRIIGFRDAGLARSPHDGRSELCHIWMTDIGLVRWLRAKTARALRVETFNKVRAIVERARGKGWGISLVEKEHD
jgi:hypothetical protein